MWQSSGADEDRVRVLTWVAVPGKDMLPDHAMQELDLVIAKAPERLWILDVSAIPLLSSNAIAQLIGAVRRVSLANGRIALARPAPAVSTVLRMTRLTKLLPMFDDIPQARAALTT
jgi:anti-anti-sigma factor